MISDVFVFSVGWYPLVIRSESLAPGDVRVDARLFSFAWHSRQETLVVASLAIPRSYGYL